MPTHETEAIVLKVFDHGESDKIITLYTEGYGKITAIAKGAKRSKRRFVNKLEPFSHLIITFATNKYSSMVRIDEAELLAPFPQLRSDYQRFSCASLICELVLNWLPDHDADHTLFTLLTWSMSQLGEQRPLTTLLFFHLHLLTLLGFHLHLENCQHCGGKEGPFLFHPETGGILCKGCQKTSGMAAGIPLSLGTLKILTRARDLPMTKWPRLSFSNQSIGEAKALFQAHTSYLLQRDIHSWKQINCR